MHIVSSCLTTRHHACGNTNHRVPARTRFAYAGAQANQEPLDKIGEDHLSTINGLIASIEDEYRVGIDAKSLAELIKNRTIEWVDGHSDLWTLKNRSSLFLHAPLYPAEKSL